MKLTKPANARLLRSSQLILVFYGRQVLKAWPVNTLGFRRVMFAVDDIDAVVARMRAHGAQLIGEMQYEDTYRLAYIRGPEGIIVALSEQLG